MSQVEGNAIHAIINRQHDYGHNVIDIEPDTFLFEGGEQDSPKEHSNDDLESHTRLIKEDTPFPEEPGRVEVTIIFQK